MIRPLLSLPQRRRSHSVETTGRTGRRGRCCVGTGIRGTDRVSGDGNDGKLEGLFHVGNATRDWLRPTAARMSHISHQNTRLLTLLRMQRTFHRLSSATSPQSHAGNLEENGNLLVEIYVVNWHWFKSTVWSHLASLPMKPPPFLW